MTIPSSDRSPTRFDPAALRHAVDLVRARGATAQLVVRRHGVTVVDRSFGCEPTALFWTFSAGKPYTVVLIHALAESGVIDLDAPVARYWPEFAANGKEAITVRHVLRHRSGFATAGSAVGDALAMTGWSRTLRRIERARPTWPPGSAPAYQFVIFGFILGEVARRATGIPLPELMSSLLLGPLGVHDTYLGLPDDQWLRHVPLSAPRPVRAVVNRRATRAAIIPSAGFSTTARDVTVFYEMLLNGGVTADGRRILSSAALQAALVPSSEGRIDRFAHSPIRWSEGFQLGGPRHLPESISPMGSRSSPRTFGHNGSNCCIAWADPDRDLVFSYLTNRITRQRDDLAHLAEVADAVLDACPE
ncbi:serine hydrolase domain-containing protein [Leifsonia poae]|uniref:serine hydrolase domain-containing protein n=1 Tax=Leifsonia poae TaxID=110933 RepID=UPI001CBFA862|nr:serine hydrolase domain-containing protein [Leifsonia poae]